MCCHTAVMSCVFMWVTGLWILSKVTLSFVRFGVGGRFLIWE